MKAMQPLEWASLVQESKRRATIHSSTVSKVGELV